MTITSLLTPAMLRKGEGLEDLAWVFSVAPRTVRRQNEKRVAGEDITGEIYVRTCWIIEKAQSYKVAVTSDDVLEHNEVLLRREVARIRAAFQNQLTAREAALAEREEAVAANMSTLGAWEQQAEQREEDVDAKERRVAVREARIREREDRMDLHDRRLIEDGAKDRGISPSILCSLAFSFLAMPCLSAVYTQPGLDWLVRTVIGSGGVASALLSILLLGVWWWMEGRGQKTA